MKKLLLILLTTATTCKNGKGCKNLCSYEFNAHSTILGEGVSRFDNTRMLPILAEIATW